MNFIIQSKRVLLSSAQPPAPCALEVRSGRIAAIHPVGRPTSLRLFDMGNAVIMPGIVDSHAHINEPGRTEWEGFETATQAAAAGGITTLIDMPLNSLPPTTTVAAWEEKSRVASGKCHVDYALWGGVIPTNLAELAPLCEKGVPGFKAFLIDSGVPEFPPVGENELRAAMRVLKGYGVPLLAHAELCAHPSAETESSRHYGDYLQSRPASWEVDAIRLLIRLAAETGCAVHIVHLSAAEALADISEARSRGVALTVETCPHYLALTAESIADGATQFKCAPPIRSHSNRERLWEGLVRGHIDFVVSDHSPCTPQLKKQQSGDFMQAWGGIAGLEISPRVVWTQMVERGLPLTQLVRWMCEGPARLAGLEDRKGTLAVGKDADFVVWDPEADTQVQPLQLHHRHKITPFAGAELKGKIIRSFVRGECVYEPGRFAPEPVGRAQQRKGK